MTSTHLETRSEAHPEPERFLVSVDVGGTKVLAGVLSEGGQLGARRKEKTERGSKKKLLDQLNAIIEGVMQDGGVARERLLGISLGVPGVVNGATGEVVFTRNVPLSETPLGALLEERFGVPVCVGNDVNVGTLGEARYGAGRGAASVFGMFVGTGIGGGMILNDQLITGFRGLAGEIGHLLIPLDAEATEKSLAKADKAERRHVFLEDLCSRTAIENQLRHAILQEGAESLLPVIVGDKKLARIRSGALREALRKKDPLVSDVMRRACYHLGLATASVLHLVDPEIVVLGGGVMAACGEWMLPHIEKTARRVAMPGTGERLRIVLSQLGDDAMLWGGAALLHESGKLERPRPAASAPRRPDSPAASPSVAQMDKPLEAAV